MWHRDRKTWSSDSRPSYPPTESVSELREGEKAGGHVCVCVGGVTSGMGGFMDAHLISLRDFPKLCLWHVWTALQQHPPAQTVITVLAHCPSLHGSAVK